ncbi:MAG: L-threonine 3-dehydrogenase [Phycisphaerales bacterium]
MASMKTQPATAQRPAPAGNAPSEVMPALVKHHAGEGLQLDEARPVPPVGPLDVLIRVTKAGICGTDRHIWQWDDWAAGRIPVGIVTGHEFVGVVDRVGSAVTQFTPGQRVSAEGHITAGTDYNSRTGNAHIARDTQILGVDRDGCFARFVSVPEVNVWPVHDEIPDRIAATFDPLGNAVHTVMAAGVSGKSVLISGVGIIGLMAVTVARAAGAARIYCTDINPPRLKLAKKLGAVEAFDARQGDHWIKHVRRETRDEGVDVLLEMSGSPAAFDEGFRALRNGGMAALLGLPAKPVTFDFNTNIIFKGCTVLGINGRRIWETWYRMEEMLLGKRLQLDEIITHEFPLSQYEKAFETMISGEGIKVLMNVDG